MSTWTRHWYDREAVAEALYSSILQKHPLRRQKILVWSHELFVSEEYDLLFSTLTRAWLHFLYSPGCTEAWIAYTNSKNSEESVLKFLQYVVAPLQGNEFVQVSHKIPKIPKEYTNPIESDKIPFVPDTWSSDQRAYAFHSVQNALKKRRAMQLTAMLVTMDADEAFSYIPHNDCCPSDLITVVCKNKRGIQHVLGHMGYVWNQWMPTSVVWPARSIGSLSARVFCTPKRKHTMESSAVGILSGSAVWQRIMKESSVNLKESLRQKRLVFDAIESEERFYSVYFPDDIPDEWTAEEIAKSHKQVQ
jgi:hypothetical protein